MFGWKIRDCISETIEENIKKSNGQNLSNKQKTALRNLIKAKNNRTANFAAICLMDQKNLI